MSVEWDVKLNDNEIFGKITENINQFINKNNNFENASPNNNSNNNNNNNNNNNSKIKFTFLVLSGAFNPIHKMHINILENAKKHLETHFSKNIIGGFLIPATEEYVKRKLNEQAISLTHRLKLAQICTENSNWITAITLGQSSGWLTAQMLQKRLHQIFLNYEFEALVVAGADFIAKYHYYIYPFICFSREVYDNNIILKAIEEKQVHSDFIYIILDNCNNYLSSTLLRKFLFTKGSFLNANQCASISHLHCDHEINVNNNNNSNYKKKKYSKKNNKNNENVNKNNNEDPLIDWNSLKKHMEEKAIEYLQNNLNSLFDAEKYQVTIYENYI